MCVLILEFGSECPLHMELFLFATCCK